jgi:nucleotide-binding universal stress UspA family protein
VFENLVVALDGSTCAAHAFELTLALAGAETSTIAVCSIADARPIYGILSPEVTVQEALTAIQDHAQGIVDDALAKARVAGIAARGSVLSGEPVYEIVSYATAMHGDAIVVGTHGRSGLKRLFLGSVAEGVLRSANLPVIVVREDSQPGERRVLVAIDGSDCSLRALDAAAALAKSLGTELVVCTVVDLARAAVLSGGAAQLVEESLELLQSESKEILAEAVKRAGATARVTTRSAEGEPTAEIERLATEIRPAFVVIGTHGRGGLSRAVMGSVAEGVVRRAPVPVIAVPCRGPT